MVVGALVLAALFLLANVVLALGQWDRNARAFRAGSPVEVHLDAGDERVVYLGAQESEPMNFDFYPSDFTCESRSPSGTATALDPASGDRLLDVWNVHLAVGSLLAYEEGAHFVSCEGRADAELLLARPARFTAGWVSPVLAFYVLMMVAIVGGAVLLIGAVIARARRGRPDRFIARV